MGALLFLMLVLVTMVSIAIYRFWTCINQLGQSKELMRLAPNMAALDGVTIFAALSTLYFAALGWGFDLPLFFHDEPLADWQNLFMALACCFTCIGHIGRASCRERA